MTNLKGSFFSLLLRSSVLALALASAACHVDDEAGLLGFSSGITHDPAGMLADWRPGTDCCSWFGVVCRSEGNKRVLALSIFGSTDRYLTGQISPSLSKLRFLETLELHFLGNISGPVPDALFTLPNLISLQIDENKLSGQLPHNIGLLNPKSKLQVLNLEKNLLTGPIPTSISQMTALTHIQIGDNFLTGNIPTGIGNLKKLLVISLKQNQLSGLIPDIFSSFPDLYNIDLSRNSFSGGIPPSLASLVPLYWLDVAHNSLTGKIPDFVGSTVAILKLSSNKFSGVVPKSLVNLPKLDDLDLSGNLLTGAFPAMRVPGPRFIDLSHNQFNFGAIPEWITSSYVKSLKLAKCGIEFKLNDWNPVSPSTYRSLDLSDNQISGSPITLLKSFRNLKEFRASNNKLRFDLGKLKIPSPPQALRVLDVSRNLAYGMVPAMVSGLRTLNVSHNHLCGRLPPTSFPTDVFIGNDCLCGPPLSPCKR